MLSAQNIARPRPGGKAHISPEGIIYCTDGKFRWVYEIDQRRHPTLLLSLLWKLMALGAVAGLLILIVRMGRHGHTILLSGLLLTAALMAAGALVSVAVFAFRLLKNGPVQCLLFTADELGVICQQVKGKTNKEKVAHAIAAWVGGQSQPALRFYDADTCRFDGVSTIRLDPKRHTIRMDGLTILAEEAQFPLVLDYFKRQCPEANIKG